MSTARGMALRSAFTSYVGPACRVMDMGLRREPPAGRVMRIAWYAEGAQAMDVLVPAEWTVAEVLYQQVTGRMPG